MAHQAITLENVSLIRPDHVPTLTKLKRTLALESVDAAALWCIAYGCAHPQQVAQFSEALQAYADSEDMDLETLITARINEAFKQWRKA